LFFIGKTGIVIDQPGGLPVGVSGEAGFLRTITGFVRRKSYKTSCFFMKEGAGYV